MADAEQTYREVMTKEPPVSVDAIRGRYSRMASRGSATPWEVPAVMPVHIWEPSK